MLSGTKNTRATSRKRTLAHTAVIVNATMAPTIKNCVVLDSMHLSVHGRMKRNSSMTNGASSHSMQIATISNAFCGGQLTWMFRAMAAPKTTETNGIVKLIYQLNWITAVLVNWKNEY